MKAILCLATAIALFMTQPGFAAEVDKTSMAVTIVFVPKKADEKKAVEIGNLFSQDSEAKRISVREFKTEGMWALELIWKHDGTTESFQKNVSSIESRIENFEKGLIHKKYISSSITWIKK